MKRVLKILLLITIILPFTCIKVEAKTYIKTSTTSLNIQKGYKGSFKITLDGAAGTVSVSSSNEKVATATLTSKTVFLDNESTTCYVTGKINGSATITINYNIAHYDDEKDYRGSLKVNVNVYTPVAVISEDTSIASIKINDEIIQPNDEEKYLVYLPLNTSTFNMEVKPTSSSAKVNDFKVELIEGWNEVKFTVTAENGDSDEYTVNAYVDEKPTVYYLNNTVGVVKNLDNLVIPEGFDSKNITLDTNETISIFSYLDLNLIYLMDQEGNKDFYLYDKTNNEVLSIYSPISISGHNYFKVDYNKENIEDIKDLAVGKIYISGVALECYYFKEENMKDYCLVYLMNEKGEKKLYSYDLVEATLQRYLKPVSSTNTDYLLVVTASSLVAILGVVLTAVVIANKKKQNKN